MHAKVGESVLRTHKAGCQVHLLATNTCFALCLYSKKNTITYEVLPLSSVVHKPALCSLFSEKSVRGLHSAQCTMHMHYLLSSSPCSRCTIHNKDSTRILGECQAVLFRLFENNFLTPNQLSVPPTDLIYTNSYLPLHLFITGTVAGSKQTR